MFDCEDDPFWLGCVPVFTQAVCCSDGEHCCPQGTTCNLSAGTCDSVTSRTSLLKKLLSRKTPQRSSVKDVPCDSSTSCPDGSTCCRLKSGGFGCCPYPNVRHNSSADLDSSFWIDYSLSSWREQCWHWSWAQKAWRNRSAHNIKRTIGSNWERSFEDYFEFC